MEVQGLCLEVHFWFDKGILNLVKLSHFWWLFRGNKPYFGKYALQIQEEALQKKWKTWEQKGLKIRFGARKISHTWIWQLVRPGSIPPTSRLVVVWWSLGEDVRWFHIASKQYGIPRSWWYNNANCAKRRLKMRTWWNVTLKSLNFCQKKRTDFQKHQLGQLLFTIFVLDPIDSVDLILQHSPGANHAKGER